MKPNRIVKRIVRKRVGVHEVAPTLKAYAMRVGNYVEIRLATSPIRTYVSEATKYGIKMKGVFHKGGEIVRTMKDGEWQYVRYRWNLGNPSETGVVELPPEFTDKSWLSKNIAKGKSYV